MKSTTRPSDLPLLDWLYKKSRELSRRLPSYRGEVAAYHPKFPIGSHAAVKERDTPVSTSAPDIVYSDADNEAISKYHRDTGKSSLRSSLLQSPRRSPCDGCSIYYLAFGKLLVQRPNLSAAIVDRIMAARNLCYETQRPRWSCRFQPERIWRNGPQGRR